MSTLKADTVTTKSDDTDLTITGGGTGVPNLEAGFKVGGTAGVPVTELRTGTDGELITWDASGDPATVAVGTATHILTSNGAGAAPTFQAAAGGGAWTMIGTQVASASATLTQTGLDSTYDAYAIALCDIIPATDQQACVLQVGDASGIDDGGTDYSYHMGRMRASGTSYDAIASDGNSYIYLVDQVGNDTGEGLGAMLFLVRPGDGTAVPMITGTVMIVDYLSMNRGGTICATRKAVIALDRIQIKFGSGNIASGRMTVWGISHA